ncbi:hypothetical protein ASE69_20750 [Sphingomonas sp. Leaf208]|nr:hypothetical protein ASE69_20750 [Sphingomonas sp. Leaf208]
MIADLQRKLATAEFDRRSLFPTTTLESDSRAWLGHAVDGLRRPWFSIVQEAETATAARTDLRIELRSASAAVVVVEIKLIHRWKHGELLDSFHSQLVDRYLCATGSGTALTCSSILVADRREPCRTARPLTARL